LYLFRNCDPTVCLCSPANVPAFIEAVKKREKVLSGFGHRVYKTSDPRSFIVRKTADEVFKVTGKDELLETAMALHEAAMKDDYFIKRKLAPNVDFWCVFASLHTSNNNDSFI
jgi:citrate synthase